MLLSDITFLFFAFSVVRHSCCRSYKPFLTVKFLTLMNTIDYFLSHSLVQVLVLGS